MNFGQRPFAYTAPSGFKALCTQNLPTPTIGATTATQANKYFGITLRNGGGASGGTYSTTIDMASGALMWDKPRNLNGSHYLLDSVRGISKTLNSDSTNAENNYPSWFTSFNNGSFTTGSSDWSTGVTVVDWIWAANGSGSTNTAGSITSTVSANTTSGFSVATFTYSSTGTVGHGLGVAPAMIIVKSRTTPASGYDNWFVYSQSLGVSQYLLLNTTGAAGPATGGWGTVGSSTFGATSSFFSSGTNYVAYCFAPIAGYSAFGSYTGNGSADGPFVFTGFRPAFFLVKKVDSGSESWVIVDNARNSSNVMNNLLRPQIPDAEVTATYIDALSNGFKCRENFSSLNASGGTYIYMAFAQNPFKYSLAR
jgi:hypothetical protein